MNKYGHSVGFLMSLPDNDFFKKLCIHMNRPFHTNKYQCIGPTYFNAMFPTIESIEDVSSVVNIPMDVVYAHDCNHVTELIKNKRSRFTKNSIGCHWYGGHPMWGEFMNMTNGGLTKLTDNIVCNLIKDFQKNGK